MSKQSLDYIYNPNSTVCNANQMHALQKCKRIIFYSNDCFDLVFASDKCVEFDGTGGFNETLNATSPVREFWE